VPLIFCGPAPVPGDGLSSGSASWPKNRRALAGRLRRAQTFLRVMGIDIAFGREGRAGTRVIRIRTSLESTLSTVSTVRWTETTASNAHPVPGGSRPTIRLQTMLTVLTQNVGVVSRSPDKGASMSIRL
jgi:hypothetical protein